ncbi:MAG: hypothetical protein MJZ16_11860 [Bacteroidales bacterium]|nr:hypothetical protein [Bacteroidales bacterium]
MPATASGNTAYAIVYPEISSDVQASTAIISAHNDLSAQKESSPSFCASAIFHGADLFSLDTEEGQNVFLNDVTVQTSVIELYIDGLSGVDRITELVLDGVNTEVRIKRNSDNTDVTFDGYNQGKIRVFVDKPVSKSGTKIIRVSVPSTLGSDSATRNVYITDSKGGVWTSTTAGSTVTASTVVRYTANNFTKVEGFSASSSIANGHEYVDLGLASGTLWATMNLGASTSVESGDYYAWGETKPKTNFSSSDYMGLNPDDQNLYPAGTNIWWGSVKYDPMEMYMTYHVPMASSNYDAVKAQWGNGWTMPTTAQWDELDNLGHTVTEINGVTCYVYENNGNRLILPAAGRMQDDRVVGADDINYWTADPAGQSNKKKAYCYKNGSTADQYVDDRYYGHPIRPVFNPVKVTLGNNADHLAYTGAPDKRKLNVTSQSEGLTVNYEVECPEFLYGTSDIWSQANSGQKRYGILKVWYSVNNGAYNQYVAIPCSQEGSSSLKVIAEPQSFSHMGGTFTMQIGAPDASIPVDWTISQIGGNDFTFDIISGSTSSSATTGYTTVTVTCPPRWNYEPRTVTLVVSARTNEKNNQVKLTVEQSAITINDLIDGYENGIPYMETEDIKIALYPIGSSLEADDVYDRKKFWYGDVKGHDRDSDFEFAHQKPIYVYVVYDIIGYDGGYLSGDVLDHYEWRADSSIKTFKKSAAKIHDMGYTDENNKLLPKYDAAHVQWGGNWQMPDYEDYLALKSFRENDPRAKAWQVKNFNGYRMRDDSVMEVDAYAVDPLEGPGVLHGYGFGILPIIKK